MYTQNLSSENKILLFIFGYYFRNSLVKIDGKSASQLNIFVNQPASVFTSFSGCIFYVGF